MDDTAMEKKKMNRAEYLEKFIDNTFTKTFLSDLFSTAFYGSSWFCVSYSEVNDEALIKDVKSKNDCREDIWADLLLRGGKIAVSDIEDGEKTHVLTLDDIKNGFVIVMAKYPSMFEAIVEETEDLYDADAVIQCAIFGEVVYG